MARLKGPFLHEGMAARLVTFHADVDLKGRERIVAKLDCAAASDRV